MNFQQIYKKSSAFLNDDDAYDNLSQAQRAAVNEICMSNSITNKRAQDLLAVVISPEVYYPNREQCADAAWFLYRVMPEWTGHRQVRVSEFLFRCPAEGIMKEAADIQSVHTVINDTADKACILLVGELLTHMVITKAFDSETPEVHSGPHTEAKAKQIVGDLTKPWHFSGSAWTAPAPKGGLNE